MTAAGISVAEPCEVMCPCRSSTSSLLSAIFLGTQLNLKRLVSLLLVVRGECPASPNPAPVASPMKRSAPRLAGPFTTPLQRSSIPLSRLLASSISSMMTMISLLQLNAPYQRAQRPLAPYSSITVKILTSDKLPAADTCKLIKDTLNGLKKRKILLSKVKSVRITRDPMVELYLRSETEQKALKTSIQTLARLASPTHIELNSLDNFRHPSRSGLVFNILDDLVELWLDKGVERITSRGQFHRLRHGYYENPSSPNLILDLQRHLVSYLST